MPESDDFSAVCPAGISRKQWYCRCADRNDHRSHDHAGMERTRIESVVVRIHIIAVGISRTAGSVTTILIAQMSLVYRLHQQCGIHTSTTSTKIAPDTSFYTYTSGVRFPAFSWVSPVGSECSDFRFSFLHPFAPRELANSVQPEPSHY